MSESRHGIRQLSSHSFLLNNSPKKYYIISFGNFISKNASIFRVVEVREDISFVYEAEFSRETFGLSNSGNIEEECRKIGSCVYNYNFKLIEEEEGVLVVMNQRSLKLYLISKKTKSSINNEDNNIKIKAIKDKFNELNKIISTQNKKLEEFSQKEKMYNDILNKIEGESMALYRKFNEKNSLFNRKIEELSSNSSLNNFNNSDSSSAKDSNPYANPYNSNTINNYQNEQQNNQNNNFRPRQRNATNFY